MSALLLALSCALACAQPVHFRYNGGRWSHTRHAGWHRYWGGPSIGFYYAPTPVYVVPGYARSSYYTGPDFWTSNPSFGISLNFGGGSYYAPRYYSGGHYYSGRSPGYYGRYHSGSYGSRPHGSYHGDTDYHSGGPAYNSGHSYHTDAGHSYGSGGVHSFGGGRAGGRERR